MDSHPVCPRNPAWLAKMLEVLPPGLRGKLADYEHCPAVQQEQGERRGNDVRRDVIWPVVRKKKYKKIGPE